MAYLYAVQSTSRPYGPSENIPDSAWSQVSRHTSLVAACRRYLRELATMHQAVGARCWNAHYRIVALGSAPSPHIAHAYDAQAVIDDAHATRRVA